MNAFSLFDVILTIYCYCMKCHSVSHIWIEEVYMSCIFCRFGTRYHVMEKFNAVWQIFVLWLYMQFTNDVQRTFLVSLKENYIPIWKVNLPELKVSRYQIILFALVCTLHWNDVQLLSSTCTVVTNACVNYVEYIKEIFI